MVMFVLGGVALCLCLVDIVLKSLVESEMVEGEEHTFWKDRLCIRKVHNKGMCLNLGEKYPEFVKILAAIVTVAVTICWLITLPMKKRGFQKLGLTFLVAGAWSNLADRCIRGYVVDYIGFRSRCEKITKITYNLGDFFIAKGTVLILIASLFKGKKKMSQSASQ